MDLKIQDVADLLNVSEDTVQGWLNEGKIPAYKINEQYRFSRFEIEDWMIKHQGSRAQPQEIPSGTQRYGLYRAINKGGVYNEIIGKTKKKIIENTIQKIAPALGFDANIVSDLLIDRENLQPTALNQGIGVPHARDCLLSTGQNAVTVIYPQTPIDYGALDGEPVHTLFFIFASEDKSHLHLLAKIAHFCSVANNIDFLRSKPKKEKLLAAIKTWEEAL